MKTIKRVALDGGRDPLFRGDDMMGVNSNVAGPGSDSRIDGQGPVQISGTGSAYDISTLEAGNTWSMAFSPDESRIYVARLDGKLDVFDAVSHAKLATWNVGTVLGALSVSENGDFLLVLERFRAPGPFSPPGPTPSSTFYQVDTHTGAVTTFTRPGGAYIDVEIVDGQTAILTGGQQTVTTFNLADHSYTTLPGGVYYSNSSIIVEDEHYTLFAETGISNGPLKIYDDRTGTIVATGDNYQTLDATSGQTGFNFGHQAISEAGGLVAQFIYSSTINLFDLKLKFIRGFQVNGPVDGIAFDITGKFLFAHSGNQLNLIDISNGAVVESFAVAQASWHNNYGSGDQIVLSQDGKTILLTDYTTGTLQIIDLHLRDEIFQGTPGADAFAGGKGDDTYFVNDAGDSITELLYDGIDVAIASVDYTIAAYVENLRLAGAAARGTGNELDNRIDGNAEANLLQGMDGNDGLYGGAGADMLDGGLGNDVLDGGAGADTLIGGRGNDIYYVDTAGDQVIEAVGEGSDTVYASASYALSAGAEVETLSTANASGTAAIALTGNEFGQAVTGNAGDNYLDGGGGADTLSGLGGNDTYIVDNAGDQVVEAAGSGNDLVAVSTSYALNAGAEVETLSTVNSGSNAAIALTGNAFGQTIIGNAGNNFLDGGGGADILNGGAGNDTIIVDSDDVVVEAVGGGNDLVATKTSYALNVGAEVETLSTTYGGGIAAIALTGNEFGQTIIGNAGNNFLDGGGGADILNGGGGNDTIIVDSDDQVVEAVGGGNDLVAAKTSYALSAGAAVETLSTVNSGNNAAIALTGNEFGQTVIGNAGSNYLDGGGGADILNGGAGNDTIIVDSDDSVVEAAGGGNDLVAARTSYALNAGAEVETLSTTNSGNNAAIALTGNEFGQTIIGNAGNNFLDGGGGADILNGGAGNDTIIVDSDDQVIEAVGGGNDLVAAKTSYALNAGAEVETLSTTNSGNNAAIALTGNEFGQTIIGNAGANVLDGGLGADTLQGLGGADTFAFTTALGGGNVDAIVDFVHNTDKIALDDAIFGAGIGTPGAFNANAFVTGTAAGDADDRIIYDSATGQLFYDADGIGGTAAMLFATLQGAPTLSAADLQVI